MSCIFPQPTGTSRQQCKVLSCNTIYNVSLSWALSHLIFLKFTSWWISGLASGGGCDRDGRHDYFLMCLYIYYISLICILTQSYLVFFFWKKANLPAFPGLHPMLFCFWFRHSLDLTSVFESLCSCQSCTWCWTVTKIYQVFSQGI